MLGALVSALAVLLVVWMVATPLAAAPYPRLAAAVRDSQLVRAIDEVVPRPVRALYSSLRDVVRAYDFPEVFGPAGADPGAGRAGAGPARCGQPRGRPGARRRC